MGGVFDRRPLTDLNYWPTFPENPMVRIVAWRAARESSGAHDARGRSRNHIGILSRDNWPLLNRVSGGNI